MITPTIRPLFFHLRCIVFTAMFQFSSIAHGQDVLLEVHAKPFSIRNSNLNTSVSYSTAETKQLSRASVTDLGLTLSIGNLRKWLYVMDLNWNNEAYRHNFEWPPLVVAPNRFQTSTTYLGAKRLEVGIGADRPFTLHDRFIAAVGVRVLYGHRFNYRYEFDAQSTDSLGVQIETRKDYRQFPNENTFGIEALGRIYFKIFPRFSIGMNLINRFGLTVISGNFTQERFTLDADGNETYYLKQAVSGIETRFAYNFSVSFGIQYQLAKRKEKKKKAD